MRKVVYAINISIDGCVDHTSLKADEEHFDYFTSNMRDIDLSLYGRKMYGLMFPYWANVAKNNFGTKWENEFAQRITDVAKLFFRGRWTVLKEIQKLACSFLYYNYRIPFAFKYSRAFSMAGSFPLITSATVLFTVISMRKPHCWVGVLSG